MDHSDVLGCLGEALQVLSRFYIEQFGVLIPKFEAQLPWLIAAAALEGNREDPGLAKLLAFLEFVLF